MKKLLISISLLVVIGYCFAEDFYQEFDPSGQRFRFEQNLYVYVLNSNTELTYTNMNNYPWKIGSLTRQCNVSTIETTTVYHIDVSYSNQFSGNVVLTNAMSEVITNNYWVITNRVETFRTNLLCCTTSIPSAGLVLDDSDIKNVYFTTGDRLVLKQSHNNSPTTSYWKFQATE